MQQALRFETWCNLVQVTRTVIVVLCLASAVCVGALAQHRPMDLPDSATEAPSGRVRLYLKNGSYQMVFSYKIVGDRVQYRSAERDGSEEIPLSLVDLAATEKWAHDHDPAIRAQERSTPVLSPELQKEEADRAARTPEVAPDLRLPEEDSVLVLDTYHGTPELVPLPQQGGDLNHETAHNVLKGAINPASSPHRILDVSGLKSDIQLHVPDPVFFVRIGADDADDAATGGAIVVDTHGASGRATPSGGDARSSYIIERLDVRQDARQLDSFRIRDLGVKAQRDVIELNASALSGGHWLKLVPAQPLEFGEYALVEVLNEREVNLGVWDFGVHPPAPENVEAIHPEPKRPVSLERRHP